MSDSVNGTHRRETLFAHTEWAQYARYPGYIHIARRHDGTVEVRVQTRDSAMTGFILLRPVEFAALKLALDDAPCEP